MEVISATCMQVQGNSRGSSRSLGPRTGRLRWVIARRADADLHALLLVHVTAGRVEVEIPGY